MGTRLLYLQSRAPDEIPRRWVGFYSTLLQSRAPDETRQTTEHLVRSTSNFLQANDPLSLSRSRPEPTATVGRGDVVAPPEPRARARTRAEHRTRRGPTRGPRTAPRSGRTRPSPAPWSMRAPSVWHGGPAGRPAGAQQQRDAAVARPAPRADATVNETFPARTRSNQGACGERTSGLTLNKELLLLTTK